MFSFIKLGIYRRLIHQLQPQVLPLEMDVNLWKHRFIENMYEKANVRVHFVSVRESICRGGDMAYQKRKKYWNICVDIVWHASSVTAERLRGTPTKISPV